MSQVTAKDLENLLEQGFDDNSKKFAKILEQIYCKSENGWSDISLNDLIIPGAKQNHIKLKRLQELEQMGFVKLKKEKSHHSVVLKIQPLIKQKLSSRQNYVEEAVKTLDQLQKYFVNNSNKNHEVFSGLEGMQKFFDKIIKVTKSDFPQEKDRYIYWSRAENIKGNLDDDQLNEWRIWVKDWCKNATKAKIYEVGLTAYDVDKINQMIANQQMFFLKDHKYKIIQDASSILSDPLILFGRSHVAKVNWQTQDIFVWNDEKQYKNKFNDFEKLFDQTPIIKEAHKLDKHYSCENCSSSKENTIKKIHANRKV
ncbi:MAG: hypothetical protein KGI19_06810 [Thaumarchaeota archaeon]|nr:hypothetical protein [Nitrososphaerota archaeon]